MTCMQLTTKRNMVAPHHLHHQTPLPPHHLWCAEGVRQDRVPRHKSMQTLKAGDTIEINFLQARPDLNGRNAKLVEFLDEHERWHAHVHDTDEHVRIKPENCFPSHPMEDDSEPKNEEKGPRDLPPQAGKVLWCRVPKTMFKEALLMETTASGYTLDIKKKMYNKTIQMWEKDKKPGHLHVYLKVTDDEFDKLSGGNLLTAGYFILTEEMRKIIATVSRRNRTRGVMLVLDLSSTTKLSFEWASSSGPSASVLEVKVDAMLPKFDDEKGFTTPYAVWYELPKTTDA